MEKKNMNHRELRRIVYFQTGHDIQASTSQPQMKKSRDLFLREF